MIGWSVYHFLWDIIIQQLLCQLIQVFDLWVLQAFSQVCYEHFILEHLASYSDSTVVCLPTTVAQSDAIRNLL